MKDWGSEPVGELCDFISGLWKGEKPPFARVNVYRNTNFTKDGTLDDSDVAELDVEEKQYAKRKLQYGDIILEKSGGGPKQPVGRVAQFDKRSGEYSLSNFTSAMRVRDPKRLSFHYLHRFLFWQHLSGITETMQKRSTGIRNLSGDEYKAIRVPLPPLPEQQRIVGILDEAFAGIATAKANAEKNLRNAQAIFASFQEDQLTGGKKDWVTAAIEACFKTRSGDFLPAKSMVTDGQFDVYGGNGVAGKHNKANLCGENIVIGRVGAKCGNVRHISGELWLTDNAFFISEYKRPFDHGFLRRILERADLREQARQAAQPVISYTTIKEVKLTFPPDVPEQRRIAAKLDAFEAETQRLESLYQQKLAALDALKKSLLHQAFSGELSHAAILF